MKLTDVAIRKSKPSLKSYKLSDGAGLYLEVMPSGSKYWRLKYRYQRKEKRLALGVYPAVSLAAARERTFEARRLLSNGVDPGEAKKTINAVNAEIEIHTLEVIAREWLTLHMEGKAKTHRDKVQRRFELYVFPWLGNKLIDDITVPQVMETIRRIQKLGILETAHRTLQACGQVFRYAVQTGRAKRDITADLRGALPPRRRMHMAAFTEPKDVAELLRAIEGFQGSFTVQCALRLAPLVFVRPGELRMARWADIDLDTGEWKYLVSKTKTDHLVPLPRQAIEILRELYPYSGHGEYVFQGGRSPKQPMSDAAINAALKRMGYDTKTEITGHGFRAMARTILHERLNVDPHVIEHQLAHKVPDALGTAYNRTRFIEQRKVMMQLWADYLDKLKSGAEIIKFKKALIL